MSETKKAGVVTELCRLALCVAGYESLADDKGAEKLGEAALDFDIAAGADVPDCSALLGQLDLVASWPPELREVVTLVQALTPDGKALLPAVLRAMASHPGDCAVLEASLGEPVSTAAKVAAWAGGFDEADARLVLDAIREHGRARRQAGEDAMADACVEMRVELQAALGLEDVSVEGARQAAQRMPRRQLKGTCPPVEVGQFRDGPVGGRSRVVSVFVESGERWARTEAVDTGGRHVYPVAYVEEWPLAQDFDPTAKPAPRGELQLKGTCPEDVIPGQVRELDGTGWKVESIEAIKATIATDTARTTVHLDNLRTWPLAEDFEPSEPKPEPRVWKAGTVPPAPELGMIFSHPRTGARVTVTAVAVDERMFLRLPNGTGIGWWKLSARWKLAEDFRAPEDAC